ncbi:general transcription factor 3C polypeptide 1-like [Engraulis encrasicolus]|uniref:general transcription factor 3C polypeptide 1-like n=1 Tax=Engraulis encrasicolus TaxID=184585 RepID=UPI002FCF27FB
MDAKKLHYLRRSLDKNNLITMQSHVIRMPSGGQQCSILLLLKRFHVDRRGKYDILMEGLSNLLLTQPNRTGIMIKLRHQLNVSERTFKKIYQYMMTNKLVEVMSKPVHQVNPMTAPIKTRKGSDLVVRCIKLLKPYGRKEDDDDDDDDDNGNSSLVAEGRDVERDVASQAYDIVVRSGTKGIAQRDIRKQLNVGKLESRMICRLLERNEMIKGFMEDEGRQRTTKYVSKLFVEQSKLKQQFAKEHERSLLLYGAHPSSAKTPSKTSMIPQRTTPMMTPGGSTDTTPAASNTNTNTSIVMTTPSTTASPSRPKAKARASTSRTPKGPPAKRKRTKEAQEEEKGEEWAMELKQEQEQEALVGPVPRVALTRMPGDVVEGETVHTPERKRNAGKSSGAQLTTPSRLKQTKLSFAAAAAHSTPQSAKTMPSMHLMGDETLALMEQEASAMGMDQSELCMDTSTADNPAPDPAPDLGPSQLPDPELVEEVVDPKMKLPGRLSTTDQTKVTYRLLKRKNIIIEAVNSLRIIENVFSLQKMLIDEERKDGVTSRVCKKSILRLVRSLSREGLLRLYRTTVIQDGISKKVEFVVHPSIAPDDPLIKSAIEQVRFRISGSYTASKMRAYDERKLREAGELPLPTRHPNKPPAPPKLDQKMGIEPLRKITLNFVPGYGRALGFQAKMPRLRLVHTFIWYVLYGHPLKQAQFSPGDPNAPVNPAGYGPSLFDQEVELLEAGVPPGSSSSAALLKQRRGQEVTSPSSQGRAQEVTSSSSFSMLRHEGEVVLSDTDVGNNNSFAEEDMHVYVDEVSWRRFVPPVAVHKDFGPGWALTSDILIRMPLSILVQIVHISYTVEGLEDYLNDPVKKHYLVRFLPSDMKRLLLYKRKYVFSFFETLDRLCGMGLMQFEQFEKFREKDQVFVYMKSNATITDTTTCEPHYNLARSSRPFEKRQYHFSSMQEVDSYWFDLLCVCLNTPLGLIRPQNVEGEETQERVKQDPQKYPRIRHLLPRGKEVIDDGETPGDGMGAGGLDSEYYAHLKRNWVWNCHLDKNKNKTTLNLKNHPSMRLHNLLTKHLFSKNAFGGDKGGAVACLLVPQALQPKQTEKQQEGAEKQVLEKVEMRLEPRSRKEEHRGGKNRKRLKKPKEPKEPKENSVVVDKRRGPRQKPVVRQYLDETDKEALQRMTRQRVSWSQQEDSFLMLCRVACHFLNREIKRPFVPWQAVRDLLHAEIEESLDKTSLAVGRRARYIMKNPQTHLNFKICLAEVYQDKPLVAEFNNRTQDYSNPKVCTEEYKEFVAVLRKKFSRASGSCLIEIPDNKEDLFQRFKVYAIGDDSPVESKDVIKSEEDIQSLVLFNLIQSTLAVSNHQSKSILSFQTFHVYSRYKQEILYEVFIKCQKNGLVNRRRNNPKNTVKKNRSMPYLPMSYQLSQAYFRLFTWRFPLMTLSESNDYLETLLEAGVVDQPSTIYVQPKDAETEVEKEGEMEVEQDREVEKEGEMEVEVEMGEGTRGTGGENNRETEGTGMDGGERERGVEKDTDGEQEMEKTAPGGGQMEEGARMADEEERDGERETGTCRGEIEGRGTEKETAEEMEKTGAADDKTIEEQEKAEGTMENKTSEGSSTVAPTTGGGEERASERGGEEVASGGGIEGDKRAGEDEGEGIRSVVVSEGEKRAEDDPSLPPLPTPEETATPAAEGGEAREDENEELREGQEREGGEERTVEGRPERGGLEDRTTLPPMPTHESLLQEAVMSAQQLEGMVLFPVDAPGGACLACMSLLTLGMISIDVSIPEQIVVVDSNMLDSEVVKRLVMEVQEEDEADEEGGEEGGEARRKVEVKPSQASHTNYLLMRGFFMPGISSKVKVTSADSVVVNACTLHVRLRSTPAHTLFQSRDSSPALSTVLKPGPCQIPQRFVRTYQGKGSDPAVLAQRCETELGYGMADIGAALEVWAGVDQGKRLGVERSDLLGGLQHLVEPEGRRKRGLSQYIKDLVSIGELLEVGAQSCRLVTMRDSPPWLLRVVPAVVATRSAQASAHALHALKALRLPQWRHEQKIKPPHKGPQGLEQLVKDRGGGGGGNAGEGDEKGGEGVGGDGGGKGAEGERVGGKEGGEGGGGEESGGGERGGGDGDRVAAAGDGGKGGAEPGKGGGESGAGDGAGVRVGKAGNDGGEGGRRGVEGCVGGEDGRGGGDGGDRGKAEEGKGGGDSGRVEELRRGSEVGAGDAGMGGSGGGGVGSGGTLPKKRLHTSATEGGGEGRDEEEERGGPVPKRRRAEEKEMPGAMASDEVRKEEKKDQDKEAGGQQEERQEEENVAESSKQEDTAVDSDEEGERERFISRPWRMVDGSVNPSVCKGMLEAVLHHIMTKPGITEPLLIHHYTLVLQPVVVLDLVQTLIEMGCVRRGYLRPPQRPSLFSGPCCAAVVCPGPLAEAETAGELEAAAARLGYTAFYEPTVAAGLLLGKAYPNDRKWNILNFLRKQKQQQQQQQSPDASMSL